MTFLILFLMTFMSLKSIFEIVRTEPVPYEAHFISDTDVEMFRGKNVVIETYSEDGTDILVGELAINDKFMVLTETTLLNKDRDPSDLSTYYFHLHKDMKDIISINLLTIS